jgi:hypothetical protein
MEIDKMSKLRLNLFNAGFGIVPLDVKEVIMALLLAYSTASTRPAYSPVSAPEKDKTEKLFFAKISTANLIFNWHVMWLGCPHVASIDAGCVTSSCHVNECEFKFTKISKKVRKRSGNSPNLHVLTLLDDFWLNHF